MCEGTKGLHRKVWTLTKILSTNIRCFVAKLRFVPIYSLFWKIWRKKGQQGAKRDNNSVSWSIFASLHGIICKFAVTGKKDAGVAKIANTKFFVGIFALAERLSTSVILILCICDKKILSSNQ